MQQFLEEVYKKWMELDWFWVNYSFKYCLFKIPVSYVDKLKPSTGSGSLSFCVVAGLTSEK